MLLCLVALLACSSKPQEVEPTPLQRFERQLDVKLVWRRYSGHGSGDMPLRLTPAITEQALYVADSRGKVRAIRRDNRRTIWHRRTGLRIASAVAAGYGVVLFGTRDGEALALSSEDGSLRWQVALSSEVLARPATDGERAIFQTQDGRVVALSIDDGRLLWSYEEVEPILSLRGTAAPQIVAGQVYAGFANGRVVALDLASGTPLWERRVAEPGGRSELERLVDIDGNLIIEGGGVFAAAFQGRAVVIDQQNGQIYWDYESSTAVPTASLSGKLIIAGQDGVVVALDQRSGTELWRQPQLAERGLTGVAVQQGYAVVGDAQGYLHWLDPASGDIVARRFHNRGGFSAALQVRDDILYVVSRDGEVGAYRIKARQ